MNKLDFGEAVLLLQFYLLYQKVVQILVKIDWGKVREKVLEIEKKDQDLIDKRNNKNINESNKDHNINHELYNESNNQNKKRKGEKE